MSQKQPSVAICQPAIILGGRLRAIIGIIEVLNELDIVPDIITARMDFEPGDIKDKYGKDIQVNFRFTQPSITRLGEWKTLEFNLGLKNYGHQYDLLINTSNSLAFLPKENKVLTYMFYPRKSRIDASAVSIHFPEALLKPLTKAGLNRWILRKLYKSVKLHYHHQIIAMTQFTRNALREAYPALLVDPEVIYPAVDMDVFWSTETKRQNTIVTIGRFTKDKRQLVQIQTAQKFPGFQFHILGFAGYGDYFAECQQYIEDNQLSNVHLHSNASFSTMLECLHSAKYLLHTLIKEPFGLTAVQAMASGCIPLVHNSGGQMETVPLSQLRYDDFDQIPQLVKVLETMTEDEINATRMNLQNHIRQSFDEAHFHQKMRSVLMNYLNA